MNIGLLSMLRTIVKQGFFMFLQSSASSAQCQTLSWPRLPILCLCHPIAYGRLYLEVRVKVYAIDDLSCIGLSISGPAFALLPWQEMLVSIKVTGIPSQVLLVIRVLLKIGSKKKMIDCGLYRCIFVQNLIHSNLYNCFWCPIMGSAQRSRTSLFHHRIVSVY